MAREGQSQAPGQSPSQWRVTTCCVLRTCCSGTGSATLSSPSPARAAFLLTHLRIHFKRLKCILSMRKGEKPNYRNLTGFPQARSLRRTGQRKQETSFRAILPGRQLTENSSDLPKVNSQSGVFWQVPLGILTPDIYPSVDTHGDSNQGPRWLVVISKLLLQLWLSQ